MKKHIKTILIWTISLLSILYNAAIFLLVVNFNDVEEAKPFYLLIASSLGIIGLILTITKNSQLRRLGYTGILATIAISSIAAISLNN